MPQQHRHLARREASTALLDVWPPGEAALREALGAEPQALTIVAEDCARSARAVAEDRDGTTEGMVAEGCAADSREPIDPCAAVDRFRSDKEATLWGELSQQGVAKNVCTTAASGGGDAWESMRMRAPSARWRSTAAEVVSQEEVAGTATQRRAVGNAAVVGAAGVAAPRFVSAVVPSPRRLATREMGRTARRETA